MRGMIDFLTRRCGRHVDSTKLRRLDCRFLLYWYCTLTPSQNYEGGYTKKQTRFGEQTLATPTASAGETGRSGSRAPSSVRWSNKNFGRNFITFIDLLWTSKGKCANVHSILSKQAAQAASGGERAATARRPGHDHFWPDLINPARGACPTVDLNRMGVRVPRQTAHS